MENKLRKAFEDKDHFVITWELIPGRGGLEDNQEKLLEEAKSVWATGKVDAVSITDSPSGNPAILPDAIAEDLVNAGITPLVHLTCKDRNRNQFESQFYAMQRRGIENLLCMTGDAPMVGWYGRPRPVFDLDSVTLIQMVNSMNNGMGYPNRKGEVVRTKPTNFFAGAVVSPFKYTEGEQVTQYTKLKKKCYAGAHFIINQVGYDVRKLEELKFYMDDHNLDVPLIANIYVLNYGVGNTMNKGGIPGCYVSDDFVEYLKAERDNNADKGKDARLQRAGKMIAAAKSLGYKGVHIGGVNDDTESVLKMLDYAEQFKDSWREVAKEELIWPEPNGFYYYKEDPETGMNLHEEALRTDDRWADKAIRGNYKTSHVFHHMVFIPHKGVNGIFMNVETGKDNKKGRLRKHGFEHVNKTNMFGCIDCGDCGLYACGYTCPMTYCPKCQRNGPCGGSTDGWCEVYPGERYCIWFKAYYRLKHYGIEGQLDDYVVPPNDWRNWATSPWSNFAKGRDSYCRRDWLPDATPDQEFIEGPKPADDAPKIY